MDVETHVDVRGGSPSGLRTARWSFVRHGAILVHGVAGEVTRFR